MGMWQSPLLVTLTGVQINMHHVIGLQLPFAHGLSAVGLSAFAVNTDVFGLILLGYPASADNTCHTGWATAAAKFDRL